MAQKITDFGNEDDRSTGRSQREDKGERWTATEQGQINQQSSLSRFFSKSDMQRRESPDQALRPLDADEQLAKKLGWVSLGLGFAGLMFPTAVSKMAGLPGKNKLLMQMFGMREIASGITILTRGRRPAAGLWMRVAGDFIDLTALSMAFLLSSKKTRVAFVFTNVMALTALDVFTATKISKKRGTITDNGAMRVVKSVFVNRTPEELYQYWQNFENFPKFMSHLISVRKTADGRSHWIAKAPVGVVEWDAQVVEDRPNEFISWSSLYGSQVENKGSVRFEQAPGGR